MPAPSWVQKYRQQIWPCVILILLTLALRTPLLSIPFERDEGEYAYIAWRMEHHELPYRDWIDQKPPAIFWVYRTALLLPMDAVSAAHFMALLFAAAAACALFILGRRFMADAWAFLAGILFMLLSADPLLYGTEANTEMFMLLPLVLSLLAFFSATKATDRRSELAYAVIVGAFIGIATAFKQVAAVQWPFLVLMYPLFADGKRTVGRMICFLLFSAAGIAIVWASIVGYFVANHGLNGFIYSVFTLNSHYVQATPWPRRLMLLSATLKLLMADEIPVWIFCCAGLAWIWRKKRWNELWFFLAWLTASAAGVSASGYYYQHYFQQMIPVVCLLAALGAQGIETSLSWEVFPRWLRFAGVTAVLVVPVLVAFYPFLFSYSPGESADKIFGTHPAEKKLLAARLAQITKPEDKVFIFGCEPEIYFYARRTCATRYIFLFPFYWPHADLKEEEIKTANEITTNEPAAALYLPDPIFYVPGADQSFTHWSQDYINQNFRMDSCLAIDKSGNTVVVTDVPHQKASVVNGLRVFGELDVRKN